MGVSLAMGRWRDVIRFMGYLLDMRIQSQRPVHKVIIILIIIIIMVIIIIIIIIMIIIIIILLLYITISLYH
jgi:hypothetical protein